MKIVIKIGGVALDEKSTTQNCVEAIAELARVGHQIAVVHGGGSALTRTLKRLGKESEFVRGLRVTDAETRDVAVMVLAGLVNKNLVAALVTAGVSAVGLCGGDGASIRAHKKQTQGRDLGFVGEICSFDPCWLEAIWAAGGVSVLCSMALGPQGEYYNVNADQAAAACAGACHADFLVFLTDVPGVKDAGGAVIPRLSATEAEGLVSDLVVSGGMLPKLEACQHALRHGVGRVCIVPAQQAQTLPLLCAGEIECGTEMVAA